MMTLNLLNSGGQTMISELETIPIEAIALSPEIMQQAIALSQNADRQWQTYLDAIAYLTICEWLRERSPNLDSREITNRQANIHYLEVNGFTLYILGTTPSSGDMVEIPADILQPQSPIRANSPDLSNTFIVIVEIYEEIEQALILGFSHHLQLVKHLANLADLIIDLKCDRLENTYQVPLSLFDDDPEQLLLYLQNLEPIKAFSLANVTESINIPELILNTGLWFQEQLDEIAQNLAWHLLPAWQPNYGLGMRSLGLRSSEMELETIINELTHLNVKVPSSAKAAYQDFQLGDRHLRLYATVWADGNCSTNPEWSLLLVLGCQAIGEIPYGVRMRVRDQQKVLIERHLDESSQDLYIYACVTGDRTETFSVSISLPSGVMLTLPAFAFHPNVL